MRKMCPLGKKCHNQNKRINYQELLEFRKSSEFKNKYQKQLTENLWSNDKYNVFRMRERRFEKQMNDHL
jgi:hypothetical protein